MLSTSEGVKVKEVAVAPAMLVGGWGELPAGCGLLVQLSSQAKRKGAVTYRVGSQPAGAARPADAERRAIANNIRAAVGD